MEEFKKCPHCGQMIKSAAKKCRYCGQWINDEIVTDSKVTPVPPHPVASSEKLSVAMILRDGLTVGLQNFLVIFLAAILYIVTIWIPYLNVGTTIAMQSMPVALSRGNSSASCLFIFNGHYRKYMGEYFQLCGLKSMSLVPAFMFMIVPALIISLGWSQALYIMLDKEVSPSEALVMSSKMTHGYKMTMFLSGLAYWVLMIIAIMILTSLFGAIGLKAIMPLLYIAFIAVAIVGSIGMSAVIYRQLSK